MRALCTYDAFGNVNITFHNGGENTNATKNPFTYRGYYFDQDLGLYYLQSRYYDAKVGRFISADEIAVITASPTNLTDKNLYAYCDNNPVMRGDGDGEFWDTVFDVASLVISVVDVIQNPDDVWAWVGLAGDVLDLIPFIIGVGESIRALRLINKADDICDAIDDINDTTKIVRKTGKNVKELHRPYIRRSTRKAVEEAAMRTPDGRYFLDANTEEVIFGRYDLGHVTGHEFWREREMAMELGWTQRQFNDYMNNPAFYRIELPSNNRSHRFELRGYNVLGD